ncbi:MAG: hypothetical protein EOP46_21215 [Sphingobacteriaceae bacterium]|nr:MAG: hypothetical protein EOP46_21215 [Sphingobacteriaceae bacterium]
MKQLLLMLFFAAATLSETFAQNIGLGTVSPAYKLDVVGKIHSSADILADGFVGIGTTNPAYKLTVQDGSLAIFNSSDTKTWYFNYSSTGNYFQLSEGGVARIAVANGGNVGINTTTPAYRLDVNGTANVETNLTVGGTTAVTGNLTVNNGKGIVRSWNGSQIKYYTQQSTVHAVLGPLGTSIEGSIAWPAGIFNTPPNILIGDITSTGGAVGPLYRVQIITYDATTNNCHFRLINTSNGSVDYNITWNIVLIGD